MNRCELETIDYVYNAASELTDAIDSAASYDFEYDLLGRATTITADLAGLVDNVVFTQAFDAARNRTQLAAQIGGVDDFANDFTYDALGRMTRVTQSGVVGGNPVADKRVDFGYLRDGSFKSINRYADLGASQLVAQSDFSYDAAGRLSGLVRSSDTLGRKSPRRFLKKRPTSQSSCPCGRPANSCFAGVGGDFAEDRRLGESGKMTA